MTASNFVMPGTSPGMTTEVRTLKTSQNIRAAFSVLSPLGQLEGNPRGTPKSNGSRHVDCVATI
jgi:hypothetical protein